jgi:hypothetical protein|tara:strand:+ start:2566 stop:2883 length:318 start_codon:yes stop_codon:yes gene_type:complete
VAIESQEPTLNDLFRSLDWSDFKEDLQDGSRQALLDCAMYMKSCNGKGCNWKGVRTDDGVEYFNCPYCGGPISDDIEAQKIFQKRLGDVWFQVLRWLKAQGLVGQ